jgi:hypothetical protein
MAVDEALLVVYPLELWIRGFHHTSVCITNTSNARSHTSAMVQVITVALLGCCAGFVGDWLPTVREGLTAQFPRVKEVK